MSDAKENRSNEFLPNPYTDFRLFLKEEFARKCKRNPKFSLRAFASLLEIESSALSKILNGKRRLTPQMVMRLGKKLNLGPKELSRFSIVPNQNYGDTSYLEFQQLTLDQFSVIADWYHYAIHELVKLNSFKSNTQWISKTLKISIAEASSATERLIRLGYLEKTENGQLVNKSGPLTTVGNKFSGVAFRKLQKQILEKALEALEEIPMDKRSQTSMTMAISTKKLNQAKKKIDKFRRELSEFLEEDQNSLDAVYHLGISLYPVTKDKKGD